MYSSILMDPELVKKIQTLKTIKTNQQLYIYGNRWLLTKYAINVMVVHYYVCILFTLRACILYKLFRILRQRL